MEWDLGLQGSGVLALLSLGFGVVAQAIAARYTTRWLGVMAAAGYFICGSLISEVWFGWATAEELQPNIDGLSFDEVLLAWIPGIAALLVIRYVARRRRHPVDRTDHQAPVAGARIGRAAGRCH